MDEIEAVKDIIYEVRNQRVIFDFDIAALYHVETRALNQAVKRNISRFPSDFMFQLTADEWSAMSSHFVTTSRSKRPKSSLPYVFTEHGVVMLSSVLRSEVAVQASILVARGFVAMRQFVTLPKQDRIAQLEERMEKMENYIEEVIADVNDINEDTRVQLELLNESFAELQVENQRKTKRPRIGFNI